MARQARPGRATAPARPGGEEAAGEGDEARDDREGDDEVDRQDEQVAGLGEEPPVESGRRERGRQPEEDAAHEADACRRAKGRAERGRARGAVRTKRSSELSR